MTYFKGRNFREQKLSRTNFFAKFLHLANINFREKAMLENFADISFREKAILENVSDINFREP